MTVWSGSLGQENLMKGDLLCPAALPLGRWSTHTQLLRLQAPTP